ncbi:hypothetical protein B0T26DRAFT_185293 [Lasiosphaeria miniovina]|uniref:Uncharacterized protein n=1 Tax=Lasiosphaeria miniovina TaxID=1954250 RepID=A0AA40B6W5_9PEZI|nr:uncharacterized protein B0T26DRAFT_185293 [Lasiosphaeria miniovina]KAK0728786.1 hypothetical protein B0T26DRAFT_185293 [Lasiosphaeria miniovina]
MVAWSRDSSALHLGGLLRAVSAMGHLMRWMGSQVCLDIHAVDQVDVQYSSGDCRHGVAKESGTREIVVPFRCCGEWCLGEARMGGEGDLGLMINWGLCCHPLLVTGLPPVADITVRRSGFLAWSGSCRAVSIYVLGVPWRRVCLVLSCLVAKWQRCECV